MLIGMLSEILNTCVGKRDAINQDSLYSLSTKFVVLSDENKRNISAQNCCSTWVSYFCLKLPLKLVKDAQPWGVCSRSLVELHLPCAWLGNWGTALPSFWVTPAPLQAEISLDLLYFSRFPNFLLIVPVQRQFMSGTHVSATATPKCAMPVDSAAL